jgi:hypothetical protein
MSAAAAAPAAAAEPAAAQPAEAEHRPGDENHVSAKNCVVLLRAAWSNAARVCVRAAAPAGITCSAHAGHQLRDIFSMFPASQRSDRFQRFEKVLEGDPLNPEAWNFIFNEGLVGVVWVCT